MPCSRGNEECFRANPGNFFSSVVFCYLTKLSTKGRSGLSMHRASVSTENTWKKIILLPYCINTDSFALGVSKTSTSRISP